MSAGLVPAIGVHAWRRLSRVLIGFGIVGLIVALLALVGLVAGVARVNGFADRFGGDVGGISRTLDRTSDVIDKAAATAGSFGATIDGTTAALGIVGGDIDSITPRLDSIADQTAAISILGANPLSSVSGLFRDIANQLRDVRGQLTAMGTSLTTNRAALGANATSLAELSTETKRLSEQLNGSSITSAIDDLRLLLVIVLGIGALGAAVPAVGALVVGLWLRRELRIEENAVSPIPG
ncbi:MAG TPA: hypothetical protein VFJ71_12495 [Candidatus Limnocylindrales bacterium]|nr:hypothetical protein [Candidatus Limnocylindrales bacterium]